MLSVKEEEEQLSEKEQLSEEEMARVKERLREFNEQIYWRIFPPGFEKECEEFWDEFLYPTFSPVIENLSSLIMPPPPRPWLKAQEARHFGPGLQFKLMTYNVLHDKYATQKNFIYCPNWALIWQNRRKWLMDEMFRHDADIVCLQEIGVWEYMHGIRQLFWKNGYRGTILPRGRTQKMEEEEAMYEYGCAIFYKFKKFGFRGNHFIRFGEFYTLYDERDELVERYKKFDNIALVGIFDIKLPDIPLSIHRSILFVCTTQLCGDPAYCDVKLLQTLMLFKELDEIIDRFCYENCIDTKDLLRKSNMHLTVCGDFNALPDSSVYEFITKGCVSMDHPDFKNMGNTRHLYLQLRNNGREYLNPFKVIPVYKMPVMPYTKFTMRIKGIHDYIFYTKGLDCFRCLGPVPEEYFESNQIVGIPQPHIPSDHFPLVAELKMYEDLRHFPSNIKRKLYNP